jgi:C4-dicarboxylate transporter DctM subunit
LSSKELTSVDAAEDGGAPNAGRRPARLFDHVTSLANSAGTLWVFGIMLLITADVVARGLFDHPIRGVAELVGYSIAGAVYLQLANTLHVGRFTRAEMMIGSLPATRPIAGAIYHIFFNALGACVFALIAHGAWLKFEEAWPDLVFGAAGAFTIKVWPLRLIMTAGALLAAFEFLIHLRRSLVALVRALGARWRGGAAGPVGWGPLALLVIAVGLVVVTALSDLSRLQVGALSFVGILLIIYLGGHIAVGLITLGVLGIWIMMGNPTIALNMLKIASTEFLRNYVFGVIPLFVMMGLLVSESDIGKDTYSVARWMLRRIKGGLGVATVAANAVFAAITGSSIASAAVFTKIAAPEMLAHGYSSRFAVGTVAGSSVLGMLIPPSLLLIIYGFVTEQSVGILFLAAVLPGIVLAVAMGAAIIGMAHFRPDLVGTPSQDEAAAETPASAALKLAPILVLIAVVLGGIYAGLFTPVEAGAIGALGALILAALKRRLTPGRLWRVLIETGHISVSILFLILAANVYARMLALSGLPQHMGELIGAAHLGFYGFMALYVVMLITLGMFLDSTSIILIVLPFVLTIIKGYGADLVWFGIVTVIAVEMGLLTPPLGLSCYVVQSTLGDDRVTLKDIFAGAFPFVVIMLIVTILLIAVPGLTLLFV